MTDALPDRDFPPSRDAALARLAEFAPRAARAYAANRNHDLDGHPHVSALSPYLRHRAVTEAEVAGAVLGRHAASSAEKFLSEVLWRTYFKGYLERRPRLWDDYRAGLRAARNRLATESGLRREWEDACEGRTGIAPFDHWARELTRTGYLHNHARMWFASIWIFTLRLPWELGADLFLRHLLDGDPASNTLSWRWVAGLHTQGRTYAARAANISKYTGGRFGDLSTLGHRLSRETPVPDAPPPPEAGPVPEDARFDTSLRTGLLLHEDDLSAGFLQQRGLRPVAAMALIAPEGRSPLAVSPRVAGFGEALARDALARLPCPAGEVVRRAEAVAEWAEAEALEQVVAPHAPVGPVRAELDRAEDLLAVPLVRPLRDWDAAAWPHCTAGFFRLKKAMAAILDTRAEDAA
jgi:deoxyribodipyrimidine photo-lyase